MDCTDDCSIIFASQITKGLHDWRGSEGVKTSRWFIKENKIWICDQLYTNWSSLSFTSRYTLNKWTSDSCVLALVKFKCSNKIIDTSHFLTILTWQFKLCCELKTLSHCHGLEQDIVLLDIGRIWGEILDLILLDSIEFDRSCLVEIFGNFSSWEIV